MQDEPPPFSIVLKAQAAAARKRRLRALRLLNCRRQYRRGRLYSDPNAREFVISAGQSAADYCVSGLEYLSLFIRPKSAAVSAVECLKNGYGGPIVGDAVNGVRSKVIVALRTRKGTLCRQSYWK